MATGEGEYISGEPLEKYQTILEELLAPKYEEYTQLFKGAVVDMYPYLREDYLAIIENPIDLLTIEKKMKNGEYETADEFDSDMRLMFSNCYTYNEHNFAVRNTAKKLEAIYNNKVEGDYAMVSDDETEADGIDDNETEDNITDVNEKIEMRTGIEKSSTTMGYWTPLSVPGPSRTLKRKAEKQYRPSNKKKKTTLTDTEIIIEMFFLQIDTALDNIKI